MYAFAALIVTLILNFTAAIVWPLAGWSKDSYSAVAVITFALCMLVAQLVALRDARKRGG